MRKRTVMGVLLALMAVIVSGCHNEAQDRLKSMIDENAGKYPIKVGPFMEIDTITYIDHCVTYEVGVGSALPIKFLQDRKEMADSVISLAIRHSDSPQVKEQMKACKDAGAKIKVSLTDSRGNSLDIDIDPAKVSD